MSENARYQEVIDLIEELAPIWQARMNLDFIEIKHVFLDSFENADTLESDDYRVTAVTETRWNYLQAKIKWYLPSAVRATDEDLERVLVHELIHVALSPEQSVVPEKYGDQMELATEIMTRAVLGVYDSE